MKKAYFLLIICLLLTLAVVSVGAAEEHGKTYDIQGVTVQFSPDSQFGPEEQLHIANLLVNGDPKIETFGLSCFLFGHKYESEMITAITHKVRTTAPRCKEEIYEVRVCSKCGDTQTTLMSSRYIQCCS